MKKVLISLSVVTAFLGTNYISGSFGFLFGTTMTHNRVIVSAAMADQDAGLILNQVEKDMPELTNLVKLGNQIF